MSGYIGDVARSGSANVGEKRKRPPPDCGQPVGNRLTFQELKDLARNLFMFTHIETATGERSGAAAFAKFYEGLKKRQNRYRTKPRAEAEARAPHDDSDDSSDGGAPLLLRA